MKLSSAALLCAAAFLFVSSRASAQTTYHVAPDGDDAGDGSAGAPWATLQHAADQVGPGDTVNVAAGNYAGFYLETSGTSAAPITFHGEPGAIVDQDNATTPDGINLEGASFIVVEGFTVTGVTRAGIRAVLCEHVTIRGNVADQNGRWGILTGFCDDLLIEDNECSRSAVEHGIYVSNSGDRPHIRRNRLWGNNANGLHMNGDADAGGDGVISNAFVEENVIWDNGVAGGSGINCDGVQDSVIWNNLLYDNHASGISLYRIDGGAPSTGNLVANNTVIVASDGRWAMNIQDASSGNGLRNNIFFNRNGARGAIDVSDDSLPGMVSDFNVVVGRFAMEAGFVDLAGWRTATGLDASSIESTPAAVFAGEATDDYHLADTSPALDAGTSTEAPPTDYEGQARPLGAAIDIGADEHCPAPCTMPVDAGAAGADAGGTTGTDAGGMPGTDAGPMSDAGVARDAGGGIDAGSAGAPASSGCGCRATGAGPASGCWLLLVVGLVVATHRRGTGRRRRAARTAEDEMLMTNRARARAARRLAAAMFTLLASACSTAPAAGDASLLGAYERSGPSMCDHAIITIAERAGTLTFHSIGDCESSNTLYFPIVVTSPNHFSFVLGPVPGATDFAVEAGAGSLEGRNALHYTLSVSFRGQPPTMFDTTATRL